MLINVLNMQLMLINIILYYLYSLLFDNMVVDCLLIFALK